jgi:MFS family permease
MSFEGRMIAVLPSLMKFLRFFLGGIIAALVSGTASGALLGLFFALGLRLCGVTHLDWDETRLMEYTDAVSCIVVCGSIGLGVGSVFAFVFGHLVVFFTQTNARRRVFIGAMLGAILGLVIGLAGFFNLRIDDDLSQYVTSATSMTIAGISSVISGTTGATLFFFIRALIIPNEVNKLETSTVAKVT